MTSLHSEQKEDGESSSSETSEAKTDRYGFLLGNGEMQNHSCDDPCPELVRHREMKWLSLINQWDQVLEKKPSKIKAQCQKGIPASVRSKCWPLLCGAAQRMKKKEALFEKLESAPGQQSWIDVIKRDTDRQFPFHEMFQSKDGQGQQCLLQVLKAYTQFRPDEGYCQAQGPVAAVLLMNLPTEESFWCLVQISELYLPGYYSPLLEGVLFDAAVLSGVLKRTCPAAYKHMQRQGVEPLMFATDWLMCLYSRHLPFNTLLRVWDLFFCHGVRVLFQVAVVLVRRCLGEAQHRKECEGQMETLERLRAVRKRVQHEQADAFIQEVCSVPLSLTELQRQIDKESEKWRKDRPDSTFDPRDRCHGYYMVWERAKAREEKDNEKKLRLAGNLEVPVKSSHLSLSPAILHKKWKKRGSKVETDDWEEAVRRSSQGKEEECDDSGKRRASVCSTARELQAKIERTPQEFSLPSQTDCNTQPNTECIPAVEEPHSYELSDKNTPVFEEKENDTIDSTVTSQTSTVSNTDSGAEEEKTKVSPSLNEEEVRSPNVTESQAALGPSQDGTQDGDKEEIHIVQENQEHQDQYELETKQEIPDRDTSPTEEDKSAKPEDEARSDENKQVVELQLISNKQEEQLQCQTSQQEEKIEINSCISEKALQHETSKCEEDIKIKCLTTENELQLDISKQEEGIDFMIRTEEMEIQSQTHSKTQVCISKVEEEIEIMSCKQDKEEQLTTNPQEEVINMEFEPHINMQERENEISSCEHEQEREVSNNNEEVKIDCENKEEMETYSKKQEEIQQNSSEQEKDISIDSIEEEVEIPANFNKLQEDKHENCDNDKESIQKCSTDQEDLQEDTELKIEIQEGLENHTSEEEMRDKVIETQENIAAQNKIQEENEIEIQEGLENYASEEEMRDKIIETQENIAAQNKIQEEIVTTCSLKAELQVHTIEPDKEVVMEKKECESNEHDTDGSEVTVMKDHTLNDETQIDIHVQKETKMESERLDSQQDSADKQEYKNTSGITIPLPEIQSGICKSPQHEFTNSEPEKLPSVKTTSLNEEPQSVSEPSNSTMPASSSTNPSHPNLRRRRSSSSQYIPTILSEDMFREPHPSEKDTTKTTKKEPAATNQRPEPAKALQTQTLPTQSKTKSDKPKRRGLFHLLRADPPSKSTIPKILIQDFSEGEEKLSSRERRRRRREQERKEKEEEKERKKQEKELEKEKQKERKKIKTRGRSFQMLSRKQLDNSIPVSSQTVVSKRNSAPYVESYF